MTGEVKEVPLLLTQQQAADLAGVSWLTIHRLIGLGVFKAVRPSPGERSVRIRRAELEAWIAKGCPMPSRPAKQKRGR